MIATGLVDHTRETLTLLAKTGVRNQFASALASSPHQSWPKGFWENATVLLRSYATALPITTKELIVYEQLYQVLEGLPDTKPPIVEIVYDTILSLLSAEKSVDRLIRGGHTSDRLAIALRYAIRRGDQNLRVRVLRILCGQDSRLEVLGSWTSHAQMLSIIADLLSENHDLTR